MHTNILVDKSRHAILLVYTSRHAKLIVDTSRHANLLVGTSRYSNLLVYICRRKPYTNKLMIIKTLFYTQQFISSFFINSVKERLVWLD